MLRSPDLRLSDIQPIILRGPLPFDERVERPGRSVFSYARKGDFELEVEGLARGPIPFPQGTVAGFEDGRAHRWRGVAAGLDGVLEMLTSSIPRHQSVLQSLSDGFLIVPADAEPFATIIRHAAEIHAYEFEHPTPEDGEAIARRSAEICSIEFVRFARHRTSQQVDTPPALAHDEALLRVWSAYCANPQRRWTVQALADAAGLGRTVFAERFRNVFGAPPLQTLTTLRLEQAETMLRDTRAPLIEIAFTIGYNSEAAFVRAFHRRYGMPPGRFRTQQQLSGS